jgi:hypothetical protein
MTRGRLSAPDREQFDGKFIDQTSLVPVLLDSLYRSNVISRASGFVDISPGGPVLVTNRHVVTGRHQITGSPLHKQAMLPDEIVIWLRHTQFSLVRHAQPLFDDDLRPRWLEHPTLRERADLVCLPLAGLPREVRTWPRTGCVEELPVDVILSPMTSVAIIGFPFAKSAETLPLWTSGTIASEPDFDFEELPVMLVDARTRSGQSGSPVILHVGSGGIAVEQGTRMLARPASYFLGVYSGRVNDESDLGFVWRASALEQLLGHGVPSTAPDPDGLRDDGC